MAIRHGIEATGQWFRKPRFFASLAGLWLINLTSGPFGTSNLSLSERALFWAVLLPAAFTTGTFCGASLKGWIGPNRGFAIRLAVVCLSGFSVALVVTALSVGFRMVLADMMAFKFSHFVTLTVLCVLVSGMMFTLISVLTDDTPRDTPRLVDRLDEAVAGPLISISGDGRYVDVVTERGRQRLLMRLSDAIAEAAPTEGYLVHRSHWVASRSLDGLAEEQGRLVARLSDGRAVAASRERVERLGLSPSPEEEVTA